MWKIKVDKKTRYMEELNIASDLFEETKLMDIHSMRQKGHANMKEKDNGMDNKENVPMNQQI